MPATPRRKIVIIGPAYPYRGGPSTYVSYIYNALKDSFDVKIYNYKLLYPSFLFPGTTQYDKSKDMKFVVPSERIINSINPFNWISAASKLKKENADLIIFDWWHPFFGPCHFGISQLIKNKYKGKIVFITENYVSHEQNAVDNILTKLGLHNADSFIALSGIVESDLKNNFPGKKVFRSELPAFDLFKHVEKDDPVLSRKEFGLSDNDKVLLFFGYIRKYKGLDILIESLPSILEKIPDAKLLIAGEFYDDEKFYRELISRLKLDEKIILKNEFVSNEKVASFFAASDLAVLPYRSATQSAVLNVAYSFNKPVVATNVGGLSEFVADGETGIIVEKAEPDKIAGGVIQYFENRDKINFVANIIKLRERNQFSNLKTIFKEIIEG